MPVPKDQLPQVPRDLMQSAPVELEVFRCHACGSPILSDGRCGFECHMEGRAIGTRERVIVARYRRVSVVYERPPKARGG